MELVLCLIMLVLAYNIDSFNCSGCLVIPIILAVILLFITIESAPFAFLLASSALLGIILKDFQRFCKADWLSAEQLASCRKAFVIVIFINVCAVAFSLFFVFNADIFGPYFTYWCISLGLLIVAFLSQLFIPSWGKPKTEENEIEGNEREESISEQ